MANEKINLNEILASIDARQRAASAAAAKAEKDAAAAAKADQQKYDAYVAVQRAKAGADRLQGQVDEKLKYVRQLLTDYQVGRIKIDVVQSAVNEYNDLVKKQETFAKQAQAKVAPAAAPKAAPAATAKPAGSAATAQPTGTQSWRAEAKTAAPVTTAATAKPKATAATSTAAKTIATGTTATPAATPAGNAATILTEAAAKRLGAYGSKYLIDYFKSKYPGIYSKLVDSANKGESAANVEAWLKDTTWFKDVNERVKAPIYAAGLANGLTLDDATIDDYRDKQLGGVLTLDEIRYELGQSAIKKYQLGVSKPEIAKAITAGKSFEEAAADYMQSYATDLGLAASQVSISDPRFLSTLTSSTSLDDFKSKVRHSDAFLSKNDSQQAIAANVSTLSQKYNLYGITVDPAQIRQLATNLYLGDTSSEQVDLNLRKAAADIFTPFRDRILAGEDPTSIASPYMSAMSRILEMPATGLSLNDPTVRKAMMGSSVTKGDTTTHTSTPLWQFEQDLYKDSRWQYTQNAREKMDSISVDVLSRFGLIG